MKLMLKIALDVLGGDHVPQAPLGAARQALRADSELHLTLLGPEDLISRQVDSWGDVARRVSVVHAPVAISGSEAQVKAIRSEKQSTIVKGFELLKEQVVDGFVSAGSTGALMAGGLLILGRIPGIARPALPVILPLRGGKKVVLLDAGVNPDARPAHLVQYGLMGIAYARVVLGIDQPRVMLLNIGEEEGKGNELMRATYGTMREKLGASFCGNIEARDVFTGKADVVVCDGFTGNVVLKCIEGLATCLMAILKDEMKASPVTILGGMLARPAFTRAKKLLDYSEYGGVPLLGLNGLCVKCHGSSNEAAIANGIKVACTSLRKQLLGCLREAGLAARDEQSVESQSPV
ncbi:MAG: phosphate acyltransferase PlsX [Bacillota bacterium]